MCGFVVTLAGNAEHPDSGRGIKALEHRGPDARGTWASPSGVCNLAHQRLSILDLSDAGRQPMATSDGRYTMVFNGEIYNYIELRAELGRFTEFTTGTDTEVLLAAYAQWGSKCLDRLIGMFAFAVWDEERQVLFAARDRFGVKPLFYHETESGQLWLASEIKALHALGARRAPDASTWADYLVSGMYDHSESTFWEGIRRLAPGTCLTWTAKEGMSLRTWYNLADAAIRKGVDSRGDGEVEEELLSLLEESVALRFRSDVPVGVCLSGGLDSSLLLGLINRVRGADSDVKTFTFFCGDDRYDETPWVEHMLEHTRHPSHFCLLSAEEIPRLAQAIQASQDEPFGGFPTMGMAMVHERARNENVTVLLDGNGMDEGWAGYDYYRRASQVDPATGPVQGSRSRSTRPDCLKDDFAALSHSFDTGKPFADSLRDLQYRDIRYSKIPRAMRFADRVSMMFSRELREPFLDHRILELGVRQPPERKIRDGRGKWLPRCLAARLLPEGVYEAPKRPVQTPQREWLRGPLASWADACIEDALSSWGGEWLDAESTKTAWKGYIEQGADNSFPIWQWISLGLISRM